jgi:mannosyl-oligosaccharide alpha-1,2-mannosidase
VTVVDALDTAIIMNSLNIVQPMLDHIASIDFTTTAQKGYGISLFETNIRYLGGLLSGEHSQYSTRNEFKRGVTELS